MTSVQAEMSSARLHDKSNSPSVTQDANLSDIAAPALFEEISARIGGRFSADLAAVLRAPPKPPGSRQIAQRLDDASDTYAYQQFALDCLREGKVQVAMNFIQRYASEQMAWLDKQITRFQAQNQFDSALPTTPKARGSLSTLAVAPDQVKIDAEAGRIAHVLGQFVVFRAWAYGLAADNGDGWIKREELETLWRHGGIASSSRHARRLVRLGANEGYWSQDKARKRIYLTGQVKVAAQLVRKAIGIGDQVIVGTNLPGRRRVTVEAGRIAPGGLRQNVRCVVCLERT